MQSEPRNKMMGTETDASYVQRCSCGSFVDVPPDGSPVKCGCRRVHRWPFGSGSERRRPYGAKIVREPRT